MMAIENCPLCASLDSNIESIEQLIKSQAQVKFSAIAGFRLLRAVANKHLDVFNPKDTILEINKLPTHCSYFVLTLDDWFRVLSTKFSKMK